MPWVKMDDEYPDHPKVEAAGPLAAWLNVCGWAYASRYLTDGFIPEGRVHRLADVPDAGALAAKLVEVELWERVDSGYRIHDYLKYNPTAETVHAERDAARERMALHRQKQSMGSYEVLANNGENEQRSSAVPLSSRSTPGPVKTPGEIPSVASARDEALTDDDDVPNIEPRLINGTWTDVEVPEGGAPLCTCGHPEEHHREPGNPHGAGCPLCECTAYQRGGTSNGARASPSTEPPLSASTRRRRTSAPKGASP